MVYFRDIYGNKDVIRHFTTALRTGNISHAYLICGEDGSGKNMLADAFTAALLCKEGGQEPCGVCQSCLQAASGNHPDIIRVTHEKSMITVNDIRDQLNSNVQIRPYSSQYKVFIVDEAELMNEAAQNALLKTLEEPPEYVVILLLSASEDMLLPTIKSRCVRLNTRPLPSGEVIDYITKTFGMPDYLASTAAVFSGGNLGKAIEFISSEAATDERSKLVSFLRNIDEMTLAEIAETVKFPDIDSDQVLDLITLWLRDILVYKSTGNEKKLVFRNETHTMERMAKTRSYEALYRATVAVDKTRQALNSNVNPEIAMEMLAMALRDRV